MVPTSSHFLWANMSQSRVHLRDEAPARAWEQCLRLLRGCWGGCWLGGPGGKESLCSQLLGLCLLAPSLDTGRLPQGGQSLSQDSYRGVRCEWLGPKPA